MSSLSIPCDSEKFYTFRGISHDGERFGRQTDYVQGNSATLILQAKVLFVPVLVVIYLFNF